VKKVSILCQVEIHTIKNAPENISVKQNQQWKKEELPPNLIQLKKETYKSVTKFYPPNTS
jgi:hypothetical protein